MEDFSHEQFSFKQETFPDSQATLEYSLCSIIEKQDDAGNTYNTLKVFHHDQDQADISLPRDSLIMKLKNCKTVLEEGRDETDEVQDIESQQEGGNRVRDPKVHNGPMLLFCITMYQESWNQILQSVAGCLKAIYELQHHDPVKYNSA